MNRRGFLKGAAAAIGAAALFPFMKVEDASPGDWKYVGKFPERPPLDVPDIKFDRNITSDYALQLEYYQQQIAAALQVPQEFLTGPDSYSTTSLEMKTFADHITRVQRHVSRKQRRRVRWVMAKYRMSQLLGAA